MIGFGTAARAFLPALAHHPEFEMVAIADPFEPVRAGAAQEFGVTTYADVPDLLRHPGLDAVYIGSPTQLHGRHVELACRSGKHVLVEKPMATNLDEAKAMVGFTQQSGKVVLVGHSHSYDEPVHAMREIVRSGELGAARMINTWCYTDWVYRPRRPDELKDSEGGGVTIRQGAHQIDIIRYICGTDALSVRAKTLDLDPARSVTGAHSIFIDFRDGMVATAVYNGYGRFMSTELTQGVGEWGFIDKPRTPAPSRLTSEQELEAKRERAKTAIPGRAPHQAHYGLTVVTCDAGEIRQQPNGLVIYTRDGSRVVDLPTDTSPRERVLREFSDAIYGIAPAFHDARWGLANLEICMAALRSAREGREIYLSHQ